MYSISAIEPLYAARQPFTCRLPNAKVRAKNPCWCRNEARDARFLAKGFQDGERERVLQKLQLIDKEKDYIRNMRVSEIKARLNALGVDAEGLLNKEALVQHLAEHYLQARSHVVTFKLRRTPKKATASKSYLVVPVDVGDVGFVDFLLDSGSSSVLITASLREMLGLSPLDGQVAKGVDSAGLTLRQKVQLPPIRLGSVEVDVREGYVTGFKVDHEDAVGGVLGLSFLKQYEVDVDMERGALSFHPLGHVEQGVLDVSGMTRMTCTPLKAGLVGVPASLNGSPRFPAIIDLSANFSTINWAAFEEAGYSRDRIAQDACLQVISGDGSSNTVIRKGQVKIELGGSWGEASEALAMSSLAGGSVLGGALVGSGRYRPRESSPMVVRDVPSLYALGFKDQPAMVLGMDLIGRSRVVLCLASNAIYIKE